MKSVLKYIGMKDIDISKYGFSNQTTYCEPFSGSFNTGFSLYEQNYDGKLIYNDTDEKVVNFWLCMKDDSNKLYNYCKQLDSIIKNQVTHDERIKTLNYWSDSSNIFKRAASEYIYRRSLTLKGHSWVYRDTSDIFSFCILEDALQHIEINNTDYKEIIMKYDDENTFFLIDPPYNISNASKYYRNSNNFNHSELKDILSNTKAKWLLTYNKNELIQSIYRDYNIHEIVRSMHGIKYKELYITN